MTRRIIAAAAAGLLTVGLTVTATAGPVNVGLVEETKAKWTPTVVTGDSRQIWDFAQGPDGTMYGCGKITQVREADGTLFSRDGVFAFDPLGTDRGRVLPFRPIVRNGTGPAEVDRCLVSGGRLYLAGLFTSVNGVARQNVAAVDLATGATVPGFTAAASGQVFDMAVQPGANRLFLCGKFARVGDVAQRGIASVNLSTGAFDPYFRSVLAGRITPEAGATRALRCTVSPGGAEMAAVVNTATIDGQPHCQFAKFDLDATAARVQNWTPPIAACERFMVGRDVDYSPDGSRLVFVTTGGAGCAVCDRTIAFASAARGAAQPVWVNRTMRVEGGEVVGDTLHSVYHAGSVVYVQGHNRFVEGVVGGPSESVDRFGIAALDAATGNALGWRDDQARCVGGKVLYATASPPVLWSGIDCAPGLIGRKQP